MAETHLGPVFEIHGGGNDLIFPHHENEIAQSRGAGAEFAHIWMHNGMLQLTGEKMSKSLGNIVSLREAVEEWGRETLLVYFLGAHWRKPIDFSDDALEQARAQADGFRNAFISGGDDGSAPGWDRFAEALEDDFNTPNALAVMHDWRAGGRLDLLRRGLGIFGLDDLAQPLQAPPEVEDLALRRADARSRGDYAEADQLRGEIESRGWEVRDAGPGFQLAPK
jgi:cysteinyl-tRNA synthetase